MPKEQRRRHAENPSSKSLFGQSILFSASLQAPESKAYDQKLLCQLDQLPIDGGMGVLGPVACVHCL